MGFLVTNAVIFTNDDEDSVLHDAAVAVEGPFVQTVGASKDLQASRPDLKRLDAGGRLLMPGLVNVHTHLYSTFARGLAVPKRPGNFLEILENLWWPLDRSLDAEAVYYSALVPALAAVRNGCTALIDHHSSPNAIEGSLDRIEEALALVGLRASLCYEVSDRDGPDARERALAENVRYLEKCRLRRASDPESPYSGLFGLHAAFTLEEETLKRASELASSLGAGCHVHLLEDAVDREACLRLHGAGPLQRLDRHGLLHGGSLVAHGTWLERPETERLAQTGTMLAHQPQSNMNNAVGRADVFDFMGRGVTVGLGTDGMTTDVRAEARAGFLMHKHHLKDPNAGWSEFQSVVLKNNPRIFERLSGQPVGRVEAGAPADLILLDYWPPTPITRDNIWGHFLYGVTDCNVNTTIVNGKILMHDKELPHVDESRIAAAARACAERVWKRFSSRPGGAGSHP